MYAVEFETDIINRYIEIKDYENLLNKHAKVIILVDDVVDKKTEKNRSFAGVFKKYANASLIENERDIAWKHIADEKSKVS